MTKYIHVPKSTPPRKCAGCGAVIYWVLTKNGKPMPVDCLTKQYGPDTREPDGLNDGLGVSHHATCPEAAHFRRR